VLFPVDEPKRVTEELPSAKAAHAAPLGIAKSHVLVPFPSSDRKTRIDRPQLIPIETPPHVVPVVQGARALISAPRPLMSTPRPLMSTPRPLMSTPRPLVSAPRPMLSPTPGPVIASPRPSIGNKVPLVSAPRPRLSAPRSMSSLIPNDVLEEYEREVLSYEREAAEAARLLAQPQATQPAHALEEVAEEASVESVGAVTEEPADVAFAAQALSRVTLFEGLELASLETLVSGVKQLDFPAGEYLFSEGDHAASFFVIVEGTVEILKNRDSREVALRHMTVGEPVGLFGLFSGAQRAACARAIGDVRALEIPSERLQALLDQDDALHGRLLRFYRERLMEGFLGSTRIFSEVDSIARARVIGRFKARDLAAGESLVQPGEVTNVIAVVTHGELVLAEKARAGMGQRKLTVGQGEFVAMTGALSGIPSRMRLGADSPVSLMVLEQKELFELLRDYPALRNLPARLGKHAQQLDRDVYSGHTGIPGL
jgi:cAMP-dependent protein kinase regulator